ncbi:chorismate mutase [Hydrogenimonas urashimensis]|uniref:chorismate mutase n=1 Tax=Hydrogenimonas urashimensis TaxID=2740515 RepID=UPI0019160621|nr:chorismate mutase [Hydrogenimonas urashimensis]
MEIKKCETLEELRKEVDKVDEMIVELIAVRNDYIKQAANFKHTVDEIKADERIEDVLNHVRHKALTLGVSPNMVADIYKQMIDAMVETEIAEFRNRGSF